MLFRFIHTYNDIISVENLLGAWREFLRGKRAKKDVQDFEWRLMEHVLHLHRDLKEKTYRHGGYDAFNISDPKPRNIHKASVRDRLLHHALYRKLYFYFDKRFVFDSYSCRLNKGTHKARERFTAFAQKVSKNDTRTCWILKCDIRKFFASVDHSVLIGILEKHISDTDILELLKSIIRSFETKPGVGLPLGNLTSQLLVNIYMNEFDQFVKHELKVRHYIRYADDFVFLSQDRTQLEAVVLPRIAFFLWGQLRLQLHPDKVFIKTLSSGVDFLGWVHFSDHHVLRTTTKRRMIGRMKDDPSQETVVSYMGMLAHGNAKKLQEKAFALITTPTKTEKS